MTTVAYIANEFPSPVEPYVKDEISEFRHRGVRVIPCSGKRVSSRGLNREDRALWEETLFFQPLSDEELLRATRLLISRSRELWPCLQPVLWEYGASPIKRLRALAHTVMGVAMAEQLGPLKVRHIHAHHGYFASWMALVASRLMGIGFSFTLHGSDLLVRADLLAAKLRLCKFCVTVSDYNRNYILKHYPGTSPSKILVQRLGVDRVLPPFEGATHVPATRIDRRFCLLAVGRLHKVKNYEFLVRACATLRDQGIEFLCWIVGEGPERAALQSNIEEANLQGRIQLIGHIPREKLVGYYQHADLVVMTSRSEGIPVVLMEAMAHGKLVLAPRITGIPELVEHGRTGFLYESGSLADFLGTVNWILQDQSAQHQAALAEIRRAAAAFVSCYYNRQKNVRSFADQLLARIPHVDANYAHPVLQQVRLSV